MFFMLFEFKKNAKKYAKEIKGKCLKTKEGYFIVMRKCEYRDYIRGRRRRYE